MTLRAAKVPAPPTIVAPSGLGAPPVADQTLDGAMVRHIEAALTASLGRIEGPFGAARRLRINPHTLRARMRKLGIDNLPALVKFAIRQGLTKLD